MAYMSDWAALQHETLDILTMTSSDYGDKVDRVWNELSKKYKPILQSTC